MENKSEVGAKVLLYDLEISPNMGYTWGVYEQSVIKIVRERQIISFAYKWLDEPRAHVYALPDFPGYHPDKADNSALLRKAHSIISQANVLIAHNGIDFDDKQVRTEFLKAGLDPIAPIFTIDTLKVAKNRFRFNYNRLDDLGQVLGVGRKVRHEGFEMWLKCMAGDEKAWRNMREYNKRDVLLLERVYYKLRPWMNRHPDLTNWSRRIACPKCESSNAEKRGWRYTVTTRRRQFICRNCRSWFSGPAQRDIKHK